MVNFLKGFLRNDSTGPDASDVKEDEFDEEAEFNRDFRMSLISLEKRLLGTKDDLYIIREIIEDTCRFYDGDWCGILVTDRVTGVWGPALWYEKGTGWLAPNLFNEYEYFEHFLRWVKALETKEPVIIPDCEELKEKDPFEYEQYKRLAAHNVIGIPYVNGITGFYVLRNVSKYKTNPDYAIAAACVAMVKFSQLQARGNYKPVDEDDVETGDENDVTYINLFGVPEIISSKGHLSASHFRSEKCWKTLAYLAIMGKPVPAKEIAQELWPDEDLEACSKRIRGYIFRMRQELTGLGMDEEILNTTPQGYSVNWDMPIQCDTRHMEELYDQAKAMNPGRARINVLKEIQALYKGTVYREYSDEQWLQQNVLYYARLYLEATNLLCEELERLGDYPCIQDFSSVSLQRIPGNANAYYWLLRALKAMGTGEVFDNSLKNAQNELDEEEYQELLRRLDMA